MPKPNKFIIPPEAGCPGLPIDDSKPNYGRATEFFDKQTRPRREFQYDLVRAWFIRPSPIERLFSTVHPPVPAEHVQPTP